MRVTLVEKSSHGLKPVGFRFAPRTALACQILAVTLAPVWGQIEDRSTQHQSFSGVHDLIVDNVNGFIEVTGGSGGTVEMDVDKTLRASSQDRLALAKKEISLSVTREGGLLRLVVDGPFRHNGGDLGYQFTYDFKLRVPREIRLELKTVNHSHILVDGTSGDFDIRNVNGGIEMRGVAGSGSVTTVNGPLKVAFAQNPSKASSFKTVNGTIDLAFCPGLNADFNVSKLHGEIDTDFSTAALPAAQPERHRHGQQVVWHIRRQTGFRIGSGGPLLTLKTVNGDVLIRKEQ